MALLDDEIWRGRVYSGGWVTASGGDAPVTEPATGTELGRTGTGSPADIAAATMQAAAAQQAWAARPHSERSALLRKAADIWLANAAEIERWSIRESGKIGPAAQFETHLVARRHRALPVLNQCRDSAPPVLVVCLGALDVKARCFATAATDAGRWPAP
jgi:benzaldehyde dehydrogenase (NAD)